MSTKVELVYEYWDCSFCGAVGLRGDLMSCSQCGRPRDENTRFYRLERDEYVTDAAQAARFQAGPDWLCAYCSTLNAALDERCNQCGADKAESQKNYFQMHRGRQPAAAPAQPRPRRVPRWLVAVLIVAALIIGAVIWAFRTHEAAYVVSDLRWERVMAVERYQWVEDSGWEGELRGDDIERLRSFREVRRYDRRQVGTRTETYHDTKKVQVGTEKKCTTDYKSTGSGAAVKSTKCRDVPVYEDHSVTKTRQVPVYEDFPVYGEKVEYRAKRYVPRGTVRARGCDNRPAWPEPEIGQGLDGKPDRTRRGDATYLVELTRRDPDADGPESVLVSTVEPRFRDHYALDRELVLEVNNLGKLSLDTDDIVDTGQGALLIERWQGAPVDDACLARRRARAE